MPGATPAGVASEVVFSFFGLSGNLHEHLAFGLAVFELNGEDFEFAAKSVTGLQGRAEVGERFGQGDF